MRLKPTETGHKGETMTLNNEQLAAMTRTWEARQETKPSAEEFEIFKPLRDEWEKLNSIPTAQRTPWQEEAHTALFAGLITDYWSPWYQWSKLNISDQKFNAAYEHHVAQNNK
jgi:hypothetical protein